MNQVAPAPAKDSIPSSWYLGDTHDVNLLTSVDGDFDAAVLNGLTAVPKDVGETALYVEYMVSHDSTIGDFERDLLAEIVSNTLVPKQSSVVVALANKRAKTTLAIKYSSQAQGLETIPEGPSQSIIKPQPSPSMEAFSVPNPLVDSTYAPFPNPLACAVTSPQSPVSVNVLIPITIDSLSLKRKAPTVPAIAPNTKKAGGGKVPMPVIALPVEQPRKAEGIICLPTRLQDSKPPKTPCIPILYKLIRRC
ncbi:MAG: hypothetical protein SGBAC_012727 [Bacillariaceae sp.]